MGERGSDTETLITAEMKASVSRNMKLFGKWERQHLYLTLGVRTRCRNIQITHSPRWRSLRCPASTQSHKRDRILIWIWIAAPIKRTTSRRKLPVNSEALRSDQWGFMTPELPPPISALITTDVEPQKWGQWGSNRQDRVGQKPPKKMLPDEQEVNCFFHTFHIFPHFGPKRREQSQIISARLDRSSFHPDYNNNKQQRFRISFNPNQVILQIIQKSD